METPLKMKVEIWSDIMCPFCYIGKRNFESALGQFDRSGHIDIELKSFQLDTGIPEQGANHVNIYEYLAERKGTSVAQSVAMHNSVAAMAQRAGLEYNFDKTVVANSFSAHRLIQYAKTKDLGDAMEERLFNAYFNQGRDIAGAAVLTELGRDAGLTDGEVMEALSDELYASKVFDDIKDAQQLGVTGVPFFIFDRRYAVSGAQPPDVFLQTLQRSFNDWQNDHPAVLSAHPGKNFCAPDDRDCDS
jgi:predicted DsbA family dithiol-disulfide isomerase